MNKYDHGLFSDHCEAEHSCGMEQARQHMPAAADLLELAGFFKVFADGTRMRILYALCEQELCVCHLAELLGMSVSAVSHQLRILRDADLVRTRREGKTVFYSLADDHVHSIILCGMEHIHEEVRA